MNRINTLKKQFDKEKEDLKKNFPELYYMILDILDGVKSKDIIEKYADILKERKIQHYDDESKGVWCYMTSAKRNPCGCGSNCYHLEYDGEMVFGVCNSCDRDIYTTKEECIHEDLKRGVWK